MAAPLPQPEVGTRFGHLVVIQNGLRKGKKHMHASLCQCDCGNTHLVADVELRRGHCKSCGCRTGVLKLPHETTKGEGTTRLCGIWRAMMARCYVPTHQSYHCYGGRGITVCEEWANDYQAFKRWAMESGYTDELTLDRIDVNGNYEPSNCRWATRKEQGNNRRDNKHLTFNGKTQTVSMWADELGMNPISLNWRLLSGWSVERALTEPIHTKRRKAQ